MDFLCRVFSKEVRGRRIDEPYLLKRIWVVLFLELGTIYE